MGAPLKVTILTDQCSRVRFQRLSMTTREGEERFRRGHEPKSARGAGEQQTSYTVLTFNLLPKKKPEKIHTHTQLTNKD